MIAKFIGLGESVYLLWLFFRFLPVGILLSNVLFPKLFTWQAKYKNIAEMAAHAQAVDDTRPFLSSQAAWVRV